MRDFLDLAEGVETEVTAPLLDALVNPLDARANDRLAGGFVVKKRLGQGSTSGPLSRARWPGRGAQSSAGTQFEPSPERGRSDSA